MTNGTTATLRVDTYSGTIGSGIAAGSVGSILLLIIAVISLVSAYVIPVAVSLFTLGMAVVGAILVAVGFVLRKLEDHRADHQAAALDVEDLVVVRNKATATEAEVHELHLDTQAIKFQLVKIATFLMRNRTPAERDEQWLEDMAESMRIGREIELRRPVEE